MSISPSHTSSTRPPTKDERRDNENQTAEEVVSYGCLFLILGWIPVALIVILLLGLFGFLPPPPVWVFCALVIGIIITGGVVVYFVLAFRRFTACDRRRAAADAEALAVQVIEVDHPRVLEIELISDNEPILAMDIGEGHVLFLQGQWLRDEETYGAPSTKDDPDEEFFNGLPSPNSFPSSSFTITRFPYTGRVLGIQVRGKYSPPEKAVDVLLSEYAFCDSEMLSGNLEDIDEILARKHAERCASDPSLEPVPEQPDAKEV